MTRAGTLSNLRVHTRVAGAPAATTLTYTVRVNGANTAITASQAATATDSSDLVHTAAVAAGDLVSMSVTKSAALTGGITDVIASLQFD